ncbi:MAG: TIGR01777 family oxidoreductase [Acidimicrobiales bacterium]|nr:TIGR01777 family oxidoreductase [Acidimicrobiales bacterium]
MIIAVTGSTGFIGSAVVDHLRARGDTVKRLVRDPTAAGPDDLVWDPMQGSIDRRGLEGVEAVIHLAGAGIADRRWSAHQKRLILESRTRGTSLLAQTIASLRNKPRVLISGSAIGFYGDRGDELLTEQSAPGSGFLAEVVEAWEQSARDAVDAGIRVAFIRTGIVLHPRGGAMSKMLPLFRFGLGGRLGSGRQWWSWITLDDEVGAICFLLDHDVAGPVNLTAPEPVTNREFTKALGAALHRPTVLPVPRFGPKLLLGSELAEELLFTSQRVVPTVLESAGYEFHHRSIEAGLAAMLGARS